MNLCKLVLRLPRSKLHLTTDTVITVFLASPGDLKDERARAEHVVAELNSSFGVVGIRIELLKWEQSTPGYGRPQEQINAMVDECDIFVGLLWKKWGMPTGESTSGFHEEFQRATARRKRDGRPDIWLSFKDIPRDQLKDPGEDLRKVLDFQKQQEDLREILFARFKTTKIWEQDFRKWLTKRLVPLAITASLNATKPSTNTQVATTQQNLNAPISSSQETRSLSEMLPRVEFALNAIEAEFDAPKGNHLSELDLVRLYLFTSSLLSRRYTQETLGVHEMNLVYKHRKDLICTSDELHELHRSMISQTGNVVPGWFWKREANTAQVIGELLNLAKEDSAEAVRLRSLELLSRAKIVLPQELWSDLPLDDKDWMVSNAAYHYLGQIGDHSAIRLFPKELDGSALSTAQDSKITLLCRIAPDQAVQEFLPSAQSFSEEVVKEVTSVFHLVDDDILKKALASANHEVRNAAIVELTTRDKVTVEQAIGFLEDANVLIRKSALLALVKLRAMPPIDEVKKLLKPETSHDNAAFPNLVNLLGGTRDPDPDRTHDVILAYFGTLDLKQLEESIDWFSTDGQLVYKAIVLNYFNRVSSSVRSDLDSNFDRIQQASITALISERGVIAVEKIVDSFKNLTSFIRSGYVEAALSAILIHGEKSDVIYGRKHLEDESLQVRKLAIQILLRFGDAKDEAKLVKIAQQTDWDPWRGIAAEAAIKVATNPVDTALTLHDSPTTDVVNAALNWMMSSNAQAVRELFQSYLYSDNEKLRARAVFYMLGNAEGLDERTKLLHDYIASGTYFYSVVTWLDRVIFAPPPFRILFHNDLLGQIG
jgi:HEAT repeat protein